VIPVALYARASTDAQEHSVPGQLSELRERLADTDREIVAEVTDTNEKRHDVARPGLDRLRDLAEAGVIKEVWSWSHDRIGSFPVPEILAVQLRDYHVTLRSLDDNGGGEDGEDIQVIKSLFSRREQRDRVRRADRGRRDKAARSEIHGGHRRRFGFRFINGKNQRGGAVSIGYESDPETMTIVVRIFEMVAAGASLHSIRRTFEQESIPNPSGNPLWSRTTIKSILVDDVYRPHSVLELEAMLPPATVASLDPEKIFGVHWSGKKRSKFKSSRGKQRVVFEAPREEWVGVAVDLTGSGIDRATVDKARSMIANNRSPSKVGDRQWELTGLLFCAECGRRMHAYRRAKKTGANYYYRCRPGSEIAQCANRKSHAAEPLEWDAERLFVEMVSTGRLLELFDQLAEERVGRDGRSTARRAAIVERLAELDAERKGYIRQAARGVLADAELDEELARVDEEREGLQAELRACESESRESDELASMRASLQAFRDQFQDIQVPGENVMLFAGGPADVRSTYLRAGARFSVDRDGKLELSLQIDLDREALQSDHTYL